MKISRWIQIYLVPGAVFQSVIVGGGYGTGREVVEFITRFGPVGGLLAILLAALCFAVILAVTFEYARCFRVYDYRRFFQSLLGRWWFLYEFLFLVLLLLILAIVGSAAGTILEDTFGIPVTVGVSIVFVAVVVLNYYGRKLVEESLTVWAMLLTLVIIVYCILVAALMGGGITGTLAGGGINPGWWLSGIRFAFYNASIIPAILYCTRTIETRGQAVTSGIIAGLLGTLPGFIFHITFLAGYPGVLEQPLPTYWMIGRLAMPMLLWIYVIVLFGTIVQTGVGVMHGFNERLDGWSRDTRGRTLERRQHAMVAGAVLLISLALSGFGIIDLVAKGYGSLSWGFLAVYILPVMTLGIYRIINRADNSGH